MTREIPVQAGRVRSTPEGVVAYAVGDIHGRLDLLEVAIGEIADGVRSSPPDQTLSAVFLGDYIDRGPNSKGVVDRLIELRAAAPCQVTFLRGNHEQFLLDMIDGVADGTAWLDYGGVETLRSYGVDWPPASGGRTVERLGELLRRAVPSEHVRFLRETTLCLQLGDYVFVHAGLRTDRLLSEQSDADKMWFRYYADDEPLHGQTVVHGHTPRNRPVLGRWRIGIDTGAYESGELTLLKLQGASAEFLRVTERGVSEWAAIDRPHDRRETDKSPSREALSVELLSLGAVKSARLVAVATIALVGVLLGAAWLLAGRVGPPKEALAGARAPAATTPVRPEAVILANRAPAAAPLPSGVAAPQGIVRTEPTRMATPPRAAPSAPPAAVGPVRIVNLATAAAQQTLPPAAAPTPITTPGPATAQPPPVPALATGDAPIATAAGPSN